MKLKGTMTIELIDEASGEAETVHEENMVTDAVDNILGSNLLGMYFDSGTSSKNITVNSQLLPICPNTLGGILLFPDTLEERKDNLYPMSANYPVAYASNDVNLGTDTARGSMFFVFIRCPPWIFIFPAAFRFLGQAGLRVVLLITLKP